MIPGSRRSPEISWTEDPGGLHGVVKKKKQKTKGRAPFVGLVGGAGWGALLAGRGSEPISTVLKLSLPQNPEGLSKTQIAGPTPRASVFGTKSWSSPVPFSSVAQSCPTLCDSMNRSTPGFPVHHQLPARTLKWVAISFSDA